jgi:hypothetical protein
LGAQFKESVNFQLYFHERGGKKRASTSLHVIVDIIGPKSAFEGMSEWDMLVDCLDTFGICNATINKVIGVAAEPTSGRTRRHSILPVHAGFKRGNSMKKKNSAEQVVMFSPLFHEENLREFPNTIH